MPIRVKCTKCQTALAVKDSLAGKKVTCPKCRFVLTIPIPRTGPLPPLASPLLDVEAEALKAFADEPPKPVPASSKTIEFECPFCIEMVKVSADLAGKQTPCPNPECKRIVKVPLLKEDKPKDWRQINPRLASGMLRGQEDTPADAWSSAQQSRVSTEALIEADAIPVKKEPVTVRTWVRRVTLAVVGVLVLVGGAWGVLAWMAQGRLHGPLNAALDQVKSNSKLKSPAAAEILRGAGEFHALTGQADAAQKHFMDARNKLGAAPPEQQPDLERDAALMELVRAWIELGTGPQATSEGGIDLSGAVRQTIGKLGSLEAKQAALRETASRLIAHNQGALALRITEQIAMPPPSAAPPPLPELPKEATPPALQGEKKEEPEKAKPPVKRPPLAAQHIAILLALDQPAEAAKIAPAPGGKDKEQKELDAVTRQGYAEGKARQGDFEAARQLATQKGPALHRLDASIAVAAIAAAAQKTAEAKTSAQDAWAAFSEAGKRAPPWLTIQLVRVCSRAGLNAEAKQAADSLIDDEEKEARALAQLEMLAAKLENANTPVAASIIDEFITVKGTLGHGLGLEKVARHNTRLGNRSDALAMLEGLDDSLKGFVWIGVALGQADGRK